MRSKNNELKANLEFPDQQQPNNIEQEMGPWQQYKPVPRYSTLEVRPLLNQYKSEQQEKRKYIKQRQKYNYSVNLEQFSFHKNKRQNQEKQTHLPYLKNHSEKLSNYDFIQGRKTIFSKDSLNFILKKQKKSQRTEHFRDQSYLLKPQNQPLKIKKTKQQQNSRYNIYQQCLFQLKKGVGLKERLKKYQI